LLCHHHHTTPALEVRQTIAPFGQPSQWAVFTTSTIEAGALIGEFAGVMASELSPSNSHSTSTSDGGILEHEIAHVYRCDGGYIDARSIGNEMRFIRRSCSPNCEIKRIMVHDQPCMALYASRTITQAAADADAALEITLPFELKGQNLSSVAPCACTNTKCKVYVSLCLTCCTESVCACVRVLTICSNATVEPGLMNADNQSCLCSNKPRPTWRPRLPSNSMNYCASSMMTKIVGRRRQLPVPRVACDLHPSVVCHHTLCTATDS
jgi:hypothetical protein